MTDQPQDDQSPHGAPHDVPPPELPPEPSPYAAPPAPTGPPPSGPAPASPIEPYAGMPGQQPPAYPYGAAPQADPYGAAPPTNPYGGPVAAPAYAGGPAMHPGSIGYVQQYFGPVASFGQRALALLIDTALSLIGLIPMIIGFIVLFTAVSRSSSVDEYGNTTLSGGNGALAAVGGILIAVGVLVAIGIQVWNRVFRMGRRGQSVGKSVIGLRLIDDKTGQPIGAGMCFLREVVHGLVNQIFYLSYLWMLWDIDKQTVGDKAVHSTVVVVPKA